MRSIRLTLTALFLLISVTLSGCGRSDTGETAASDDDLMNELMGPSAEPQREPALA